MSPKFLVNMPLAIAGGFLVIMSRALTPNTAGWVGLGIGVFAVVLAGAGLAATRLQLRSTGYGVMGAVGIWTIVSSTVFNGTALGWLMLADGIAIAAVAIAELTVHEMKTEHVVHTLVVSDSERLREAA